MRFVCDEMLKRLGQWLRVAGYDVLILADGSVDRLLVDRARAEHRVLLSSDRKLAEHRDARSLLVLLECQGLDDCVAALNRRMPIDWLHRRFSRCMVCNTPLDDADDEQRRQLPDGARESAHRVCWCPTCRQLFWHGSHVDRMHERLERWHSDAARLHTADFSCGRNAGSTGPA